MPSEKQKVYRLSNIPADADRHTVFQLLVQALSDVSYENIQLFSLAFSIDHLDGSRSKLATLTFNKVPNIVKDEPNKSQWKLQLPGLSNSLILDTHFLGFTPLNDVSAEAQICSCIAISGLSSHPFGSWQPHGSDKSFMWIRDSLPRDLPGVRTIIYGYDTALINSTSFQTIQDISLTLIHQLKANGWASPGSKNLVFLAHSLGGVILKEALVSMAGSGEREKYVLSLTKGAIFFGVPSHGMHISHFLAMVGSQPNQDLIRDLSSDSTYLMNLDKRFEGISVIRQMKLFWAYETKTSPLYTVISRSSSEAVLVTPDSATRGLISSNPAATIQIDASHSDIVKFVEHYHKYDIILSKLREICGQRPDHIAPSPIGAFSLNYSRPVADKHGSPASLVDPNAWDYTVKRLHAPQRDHRLEQIEKKFGHTFDWVFDDRSVGLSKWLQDGQGIFWISGKPGSGKSTLTKFIVNDPRTHELRNRWTSKATMITANFFFHHRGSTIQKSLSGLLRSILSQILEHKPRLHLHLRPVLDARFIQLAEENSLGLDPNLIGDLQMAWKNWGLMSQVQQDPWSIGTLKSGLRQILDQKQDELDICLFLDALDEYDGQPDVISRFIQDLAQQSHDSPSRIRICFSSRPWDAFVELFKEVPGFKIHEHTEDDIEKYCIGNIKTSHNSETLSDLVPAITRRARGVFLWVKLVLQDLTRDAANGATGEQLKETLGSFPDDLYTYYTRIVERIAPSSRWATYCALELVSRLREGLSLVSLLEAVSCSRSQDYLNGRDRLSKFRYKASRWSDDDFEGQIRVISGGLLDVVAADDQKSIQFMHQTVEEFAERPQLKQIVLGDDSRETHENGHSILAKYYLLISDPRRAIYHARAAEQTTGRSLSTFISSIPSEYLELPFSPFSPFRLNETAKFSALTFAAYGRLQLYLRDESQSQPSLYSTSTEPLLSSLIMSLTDDRQTPPELEVLSTMTAILSYGYSPQNDRNLFKHLLSVIWMSNLGIESGRIKKSYLCTLISFLLDHGLDLNERVELLRADDIIGVFRPLHLCTPVAAKILLERGADANVLDDLGFSPLDLICLRATHHFVRLSETDRYEMAALLTKHGGGLQKATVDEWSMFVASLAGSGLDVTVLKGLPVERPKRHRLTGFRKRIFGR
ncbi:uncharacterized protein TRIVIDRAFT_150386 [Trichoderma virens Gv29-8]|uniref:Nephrocystin 3-like N-terminal domain-containing protein n=1 Tax=Hypocrea virens (strain Gv29-8 / FGSC 10586) TaxID=413071 RepID=G9MS60_HYPVG|nr:uncharacterized protein TRIVIDRAFT_150386 [Trichoderma virens Gv29-8]EHK22131.1 hypothetical protein TRIVIDRAFT_150386 [Trichoderma virens Gv29-8]